MELMLIPNLRVGVTLFHLNLDQFKMKHWRSITFSHTLRDHFLKHVK